MCIVFHQSGSAGARFSRRQLLDREVSFRGGKDLLEVWRAQEQERHVRLYYGVRRTAIRRMREIKEQRGNDGYDSCRSERSRGWT